MEKRRLSLFGTFFFKFGLPALWISVLGSFALPMFRSDAAMAFFFFLAGFIVTIFIFWRIVSFKKVYIDGTHLIISNYIKTIRVQLSQIYSVSENFFFGPKLVWIFFKSPTVFGTKIKFTPIISLKDIFCQFTSHSVVEELRTLAQKNSTDTNS